VTTPTSEPTTRTCPRCGRPLPTFTIPGLRGRGEITLHGQCDCEAAEERAERRMERAAQLESAWKATGVPMEYRGVEPDRDTLSSLDLDAGNGLYVHGSRGTGKTTMACRVLKAYVATHTGGQGWCSARFVSAPAWLDRMRDAYDRRGASAEEEFERASRTAFLVLDDVGKFPSRVTDWAVGKLFRLVDERCSERRPTVFTSKYSPSALYGRLVEGGDPDTAGDVVSRIRLRCRMVPCSGEDMRLRVSK